MVLPFARFASSVNVELYWGHAQALCARPLRGWMYRRARRLFSPCARVARFAGTKIAILSTWIDKGGGRRVSHECGTLQPERAIWKSEIRRSPTREFEPCHQDADDDGRIREQHVHRFETVNVSAR